MSCWSKTVGSLLLAAPLLLAAAAPASASINLTGALVAPAISAAKYCSGAFRYAARDGNSDIVELSPAQVFSDNRRFARGHYAGRALAGLADGPSRLLVLSAMCGAR